MQKDNSLRIKKLLSTLLLFLIITVAHVSADTMSPQSESSTMPFISENTIYVDDDYNETTPGWGVDHFDNIQDAVDNASDGDAIYVFNGIYYENVVIDKRVNLTGEDKNSTIIDGSNTGKVVSITIREVVVDGFTIRNSGYFSEDAGVYVGSYTNTITNNIITENQHGVYIVNSKSNNILENTITNCDYGIYLINSDFNSLKENTITKNKYGIYLQESSFNDVNGNIVEDNEDGMWLKLYNQQNTINGNTITQNSDHGILLESYCDSNVFHHNNFIDNKIHAHFIMSYLNSWEYNYWDNWVGIIIEGWHIFPKVIFGYIFGPIPWLNFDWYPHPEPHSTGPS